MSSDQKLTSALYKLAQENFSVSDDTILDKLYFHIEESPNFKGITSTLLPQLGNWLDVIIQGWNNKVLYYGVKVFFVRFMGNIGSDIIGFKMLQDHDVLNFLKNLVSSSDLKNDSGLIVPLVNTFAMFLKHEDGWKWTTESEIWRCALNLSYDNGHMYTKRAVVKYLSQILITSTNYVTIVGDEIMSFICKPLLLNHLLVLKTHEHLGGDYGEDYVNPFVGECSLPDIYKGTIVAISARLLNAVKFLCDILENILGNNTNSSVHLFLIYKLCGDTLCSQSNISKYILDNCASSQDHITFSSLIIMVEVNKLLSKKTLSCKYMECCLQHIYFQIEQIVKSLILVGHLQVIPNFCVTCLYWLSKIKQKKTNRDSRCRHCDYFESTILCCLRIFLNSHSQFSTLKLVLEFQYFTIGVDLSKKVNDEDLTDEGQTPKKHFQFMQLALSALPRIFDVIDKHENLLCLLENIVETFHSVVDYFLEEEDLHCKINNTKLLLLLLDITCKMVQNNRLTTRNIIYIIFNGNPTIMDSIFRLLGCEAHDIRVTILSLQALTKYIRFHILIEIVTEESHHLSESLEKELRYCDNPILAEQLKCKHWEVRDTVIELFQTALDMKELMPWFFDKTFPPSLLKLIFEKASKDESAYVRASALNFFSKTVRCKFFADVIHPKSLLNLALKILIEDNMPAARKSACDLIAALYISYVPVVLTDIEEIFETVFLASTKDLDWEVKKSTLKFWQCTIEKDLLEDMLALKNVLPSLLNTPVRQETVSRIIKVLQTLGESGCLKAIWLSLNDDCDLKVSQEAQGIVERLEELNERCGFVDDILNYPEDGEEEDSIESPSKIMTPKLFFSLLKNENWREKINSYQQWIQNTCDSLPSLLDHILDDNRLDDGDHNAVDCY